MAAYATPADLIMFYDWNRVGEWCRDDRGVPASTAEVIADPNVIFAMQVASGEVDAACRVGQRYKAADLRAMITPDINGDVNNAGAFLKRLVCDLAYEVLVSRRGLEAQEVRVLCPRAAAARLVLQQLREGERILDDANSAEAEAGVHVETVPGLGMNRPGLNLLSNDRRFFGSASRPLFRGGYGDNGCC